MSDVKQLCRACGTELIHDFADLGPMPLANSYPKSLDDAKNQNSYPLHARVCSHCFLVQVEDSVPAEDIFSDYAYFSSYSPSWVEHARKFTEYARDRFDLGAESHVVEIASNDGYLLQHFVAAGVPVRGVEPAANIAKVAEEKGIPTLNAFFGDETANAMVQDEGKADLIVGNNVLAHTPFIRDFVKGLKTLLKPEGVISIEFPHLLKLMEEVQFDTIYHEHFSYLSLEAVERLFAEFGLRLFDVQEVPTHGGSLRIHGCHRESDREECLGLIDVRTKEKAAGLDRIETYSDFFPKIEHIRKQVIGFLEKAKQDGKKVVAYGAAAKGSTLLNYFDVGRDDIDYAVDANPHKQDHFMPGSMLDIRAPQAIRETKPDYILILPWNLKREITEQLSFIREWDGKCYAPIPELHEVPWT
ncbi:class I SAM-dependent methyltransferase [Aestuariispira insulae]|uniref:Methyltransferase family protein n=1 Tax=Aestuariispira insulae TaxID=1461337 RepID=A0A3D9HMX7_9PROT|nr:class I SAM-dependent methyltransferase [Aestuariispira insulae]RED50818.1 methyltransferase family protein [Aestuariispira insulae]